MDITQRKKVSDNSLPCFVLPMCAEAMIVPSVTVAEVIDYRPPEPLPGAPAWFMGVVDWRGIAIPVISFERFNHLTESRQGSQSRLAIMNVVSNQHYMRYFSVVIQGNPKPVKIMADTIEQQDDSMSDGIAMKVLYAGQNAMIPDMDAIERSILTCHQWSKRFNIQASVPSSMDDD